MKLLFVYNANSGPLSSVLDSIHKTFSPDTYQCQLCALTYGPVSMKKSWKKFLGTLNLDIEFLHKDQFKSRFPSSNITLPAIVREDDSRLEVLLSSQELKQAESLGQLILLLKNKLG